MSSPTTIQTPKNLNPFVSNFNMHRSSLVQLRLSQEVKLEPKVRQRSIVKAMKPLRLYQNPELLNSYRNHFMNSTVGQKQRTSPTIELAIQNSIKFAKV